MPEAPLLIEHGGSETPLRAVDFALKKDAMVSELQCGWSRLAGPNPTRQIGVIRAWKMCSNSAETGCSWTSTFLGKVWFQLDSYASGLSNGFLEGLAHRLPNPRL